MKTKFSTAVVLGIAVCCVHLAVFAADKPESAAVTNRPATRHVVYQVPKTCIHWCTDNMEATRRWKATGELSSIDIFRFNGPEPMRRLDPIARAIPMREFGGGTDAEPSPLGMDVTDEQDKLMRDAIAKGELFIIYYHYGW